MVGFLFRFLCFAFDKAYHFVQRVRDHFNQTVSSGVSRNSHREHTNITFLYDQKSDRRYFHTCANTAAKWVLVGVRILGNKIRTAAAQANTYL